MRLKIGANKKAFVITDSVVGELYLSRVVESMEKAGYKAISAVFEAGEHSKNLSVFGELSERVASAGLNRGDVIVALGGGVCGDLAGFVAASYMRGIDCVQVPTTLLAAIDSSVGGKTAVNLRVGKNMVGAFHQPSLVVADTDALKTLPDDELKCGLGEAVKYALLAGGEIYELLSKGFDFGNAEKLIELCVRHKAAVVEADEKENGLRRTLNLGHTFGHAYERLSDFTIKHGTAVAFGLVATAKAELRRGALGESEFEKIMNLIDVFGFGEPPKFDKGDIMRAVAADKKVNGGDKIHFVGLTGIGKPQVETISLKALGELI